jgi:hypothetical protein
MGAYCTLLNIRRHPATLGEIMEVRSLSLLFNHRGCSWGTMSGWRSSAPLLTQGGH